MRNALLDVQKTLEISLGNSLFDVPVKQVVKITEERENILSHKQGFSRRKYFILKKYRNRLWETFIPKQPRNPRRKQKLFPNKAEPLLCLPAQETSFQLGQILLLPHKILPKQTSSGPLPKLELKASHFHMEPSLLMPNFSNLLEFNL